MLKILDKFAKNIINMDYRFELAFTPRMLGVGFTFEDTSKADDCDFKFEFQMQILLFNIYFACGSKDC